MSELPIAPVERILRNAGAPRVSTEGAEALKKLMEEFANEIAVKAVKMAKHAGRRTIRADDIMMAKEQ